MPSFQYTIIANIKIRQRHGHPNFILRIPELVHLYTPIIKMGRSNDRLILIMGVPITGKMVFILKQVRALWGLTQMNRTLMSSPVLYWHIEIYRSVWGEQLHPMTPPPPPPQDLLQRYIYICIYIHIYIYDGSLQDCSNPFLTYSGVITDFRWAIDILSQYWIRGVGDTYVKSIARQRYIYELCKSTEGW